LIATNVNTSNRIYIPKYSEVQDIYYTMSKADILITDYSGVYFDFLLLDRPIIFTPFDIHDYINNDRELYYNYDEVTPGPKARNWTELLRLLELATIKDDWKSQRAAVRDQFHQYTDNKSSERVFQMVEGLLRKSY
jgi:CDP-glycerol glycerophosphotransferase (TagB/SpsB family)